MGAPELELPTGPGTYALLLAVPERSRLDVGRLGRLDFDAPFYLYTGSARGPGGLAARLGHHLRPAARPHWHIDLLRRAAAVQEVWFTCDPRRLECHWASAAGSLRDAAPVPGFGASDCRCRSHLFALPRLPRRAAFRRRLDRLEPPCRRIRLHRPPL